MENSFDLIIIGGGPGGYVCAIRASQLGLKTAVVEKRPVMGGTCVNVGCIPSKALLDSSEHFFRALHGFADHGITADSVKIDVRKMMERKTRIVKELTDGLKYLMDKNKITVFQGSGRIEKAAPGSVTVKINELSTAITGKYCVIATGSEIIDIPNVKIDGKKIITSDHAIALEKIPEHLAIIGAGVIGLELGSVWRRLGSKITVIEILPDILMGLDRQMRELARRILEKQGMSFLFEQRVTGAQADKSRVNIQLEKKDGSKDILDADCLLVAVGRRPYTEGLGLPEAGIKLNARGRIEVDRHSLETSVPGIFAIGDVIEGPMLAHRAEDEGVMIAERIAGKAGHINYDTIPFIVYTWPEIAWVGRSEEQLTEAGIAYNTGKFLFRPNGRAKAMNEADGQVKIIADKKTDRILGACIVGPNASELIAECVLAMEFGASAEDLARTVHAHPTLSETVKEAALAVDRRSIHS